MNFLFFFTSFFVVSVLLCFVREQMRKKPETKREKKQRKKRIEKRPKNLLLSRRVSKTKATSPYIYTHTLVRTESVHNREGTLSLSLSLSFCTALFLYIS